MLAPIITKDMKLFPSRPLPPKVKNVRSRAQSLDDLKNPANVRGRVITLRQRSSQSVGHLPLASRSPPKVTGLARKPGTLDAIVEGVEMSTSKGPSKAGATKSVSASSIANSSVSPSADSSDMSRPESAMSTSSAPALEKQPSSGPKAIVKWITGALKPKSKRDEEEEENSKMNEVAACS